MQQIITLGSDQLRQKAEKVEKFDEDLIKTASLMLETVKKDKGVGLAGPQIGFMKRIFVTHIEGDEERIFINPSILETSQETTKVEEGCLSVPGIYAKVIRSKSIKVQAWNEKGRPFTMETGGLLARVIQHEYDHLEGVLFLDRLPEEKRDALTAKFEKKSRNLQRSSPRNLQRKGAKV
ncbi:MAG: peptide deformylase [Treponema sp.]|jgi:peptide deformylase|nr:peptide deformylase [Treponema sp.]